MTSTAGRRGRIVPGMSTGAGLVARAWAAGVGVLPLSTWDAGPPSPPGLVLGDGAIATDRVEEGLARLRRAFDG
jgi:DNA-binding transcriptional MocR family regulator